MSGHNSTQGQEIDEAKISIVAGRFNHQVVDRLLDACVQTLNDTGLQDQDITVVRVPGAFEIPAAVQHILRHTTCDAVITLGAVIRGETPHFDYISSACTSSLGQISISSDIPVILGVLTVDNMQQAMDRAGTGKNNKGVEVALAAIEMIHVFRSYNR